MRINAFRKQLDTKCAQCRMCKWETTVRVILFRMPLFDALNIEKHAQYIANYRVFMCDLAAKVSKVGVTAY